MVTNNDLFRKKANQTVQNEFERKAKDLIIARQHGQFSGRMHVELTKALQNIFVYRNGEVDWVLTYEVRLRAQHEHYKSEELKRDRRIS